MSERLTFTKFMAEHHLAIDGKRHDNPHHSGRHSHQRRIEESEAELRDYEENLAQQPLSELPGQIV